MEDEVKDTPAQEAIILIPATAGIVSVIKQALHAASKDVGLSDGGKSQMALAEALYVVTQAETKAKESKKEEVIKPDNNEDR